MEMRMANRWHKVMVNGIARYRSSASKSYVSYNVAKDSWSSKMLPGNMPVEQLAKAPRVIKVKGTAWGVEVVRSYMEGELPVTHVLAYRGVDKQYGWVDGKHVVVKPADPTQVYFASYSAIESDRAENVKYLAQEKARIGKAVPKYHSECHYNDVVIVELS
jgi:hypothetical protein